ncbi:22653_t:CDS:1, partial [Gigaspora rosea]
FIVEEADQELNVMISGIAGKPNDSRTRISYKRSTNHSPNKNEELKENLNFLIPCLVH